MTGLPSALRRGLFGDILLSLGFGLLGAAAAWGAFLLASSIFLQLGPNSGTYLRGFRPGGPERDGAVTRFHWTTNSSLVELPVRAAGDGFVLRARVRRHMVEPAQVSMRVEGRVVHQLSIAADTKNAYQLIAFSIPTTIGRHAFALGIESSSIDPRPLGVAIDWIELKRAGPARLRPLNALALFLAVVTLVAYAAPRAAGLSRPLAAGHSVALGLLAVVAGSADPLALDRIVRDGVGSYMATATLAVVAVAFLRRRGLPADVAGLLALLVLVAVELRLGLLLHPRFYYPDMAIHGRVAYVLSKEGALTFVQRYFETQFRFSLGLQFQSGHTYAFPYAPGLYFLCWPLIAVLKVRPEVAVASAAAVLNSLGIVVTFALTRFLLRSDRAALVAGLAHLALPLFLIRLTMAYFPSVTGHAVDAAALTLLMYWLRSRLGGRRWLAIGALLSASLLLYPQAIVNFAILFGVYLAWDILSTRAANDRYRQIGLAVTVALALAAATAAFYHRYVPVFIGMQQGIPMVEEQILLDKQRVEREYAASRGEELVPHVEIDAYSGPGFNPIRGAYRVIARLFIFHGPFLITVLWGLALLARGQEGTERRFVIVWASLFFVVCFLAGALPAPNFLRYSKDLEASAPLFCAAFGLATIVIAKRSRALAVLHVVGFVAMGLWRGMDMWLSTFEPR